MSTFNSVPLGELATLRAGVGFPMDLQGRTLGDYPLAKVGDISRVGRSGKAVITFADHYIDEGDLVRLGAKLVPKGGILFAKIGEAMIHNHRVIAGRDMLIDNNAMAAIPGKRLVSRYLYHFLRTVDFYRLATATTVPALRKSELEKLEVPLPLLPEQRRIAKVLDQADVLRSKRRAALAQLDSLTQSLFLDLFGDPASPTQQYPKQPLETLLKQPLQNGAYYQKEFYTDLGGVEMVHMSDAFYEIVPRGHLKRVICSESDVKKYALSEYDVLIARRSLTLEGAAKPCLVPKSIDPLIFESSFIRVTPHPKKMTALYLYHYLRNERVKQKCVQPYITQSTISGINQSNLERVPVIVPPLPLQQDFARRVRAVEKLRTAQRASLAEFDALFATLQHRAFRGEL